MLYEYMDRKVFYQHKMCNFISHITNNMIENNIRNASIFTKNYSSHAGILRVVNLKKGTA